MRRRDFLRKSILTGVGISLGEELLGQEYFGGNDGKKITILHTNDLHSRIEPFPDDGGRWANQGGLTKLSALVSKIREEENNILLLDAGDIFQGTPYFNVYGGELELQIMNKMGYDASTLGNHEFDNGLEGIITQIPKAGFSFISSNYDFSKTILKEVFLPYKIFRKNGIKVGVFALGVELKGLVASKNYRQTQYLDPVGKAREMVQELKSKHCDLIVCLSHLGFSYQYQKIDDLKLAAQVDEIDLIIGGHTHTFLDDPVRVNSPMGYPTLINQAGTGGLRLGKVEFEFKKDNSIKIASSKSIPIY